MLKGPYLEKDCIVNRKTFWFKLDTEEGGFD